jgi:hypothetical protein
VCPRVDVLPPVAGRAARELLLAEEAEEEAELLDEDEVDVFCCRYRCRC